MSAEITISDQILESAIAKSIESGNLSEKLKERIAEKFSEKLAEITTYNASQAAKILNISRSTLYEYRNAGLLTFRADGRIALLELLNFGRNFPEKEVEILRREKQERRKLK